MTTTRIDEYMAKPYRVEIRYDREVEGWVCSAPELPGCVASGETQEEAVALFQKMKCAWFEAALELGRVIPEPKVDGVEPEHEFSGRWVQRVPRSLHGDAVRCAEEEGVSLNQLVSTVLAKEVGARSGRRGAATERYAQIAGETWPVAPKTQTLALYRVLRGRSSLEPGDWGTPRTGRIQWYGDPSDKSCH